MKVSNKFYLGRYTRSNKFRGWFLGSFFKKKHPCKTNLLEIFYREHKKGDVSQPHYHKKKIEVLLMIVGKAKYKINNKIVILKGGNFLFINTKNIIYGEFLKPSKIFAIHAPSIPRDKILVGN